MKKIKTLKVAFKENEDIIQNTGSGQEMTTMPTSLLEQLVSVIGKITTDNKVDKIDTNLLANAIVDGFAMKEGNRNGVVNRRTYTKDTLPLEDILEKPVMFFAFCNTTIIFDDVVKGGLTINAPYHPIVFNPYLRYEQPGQKGKIITQCMALVWSKKQVEFVRNHSLFSIEYFEKLSDATNYSVDLIDKVVAAYERVKHLNEFQVKQKCIEMNINIDTQDFKVLRKKIAHVMAQDIQKAEDFSRAQEVEDTSLSQQIKSNESSLTGKVYKGEPTY